MSKATDGWRAVRNRSVVQEFGGAAHDRWPEISALLCGTAGTSGTVWDRPPLSLRLYLDGDHVVFCFSAEDFPMQLWGSCPSLREGLDGIEQALCKEHFDWRKKKSYDNGFTKHR